MRKLNYIQYNFSIGGMDYDRGVARFITIFAGILNRHNNISSLSCYYSLRTITKHTFQCEASCEASAGFLFWLSNAAAPICEPSGGGTCTTTGFDVSWSLFTSRTYIAPVSLFRWIWYFFFWPLPYTDKRRCEVSNRNTWNKTIYLYFFPVDIHYIISL